MDIMPPETFGTEGQQTLQKRAWALWQLLKDDPDYSCYGRAVGLTQGRPDNIAKQVALAQLLGAAACEYVPDFDMSARDKALRDAGLSTDSYVMWLSSETTTEHARQAVRNRPLPDDLTVHVVDDDTPSDIMAQMDQVTQTCGVLPPIGQFLRGQIHPAYCILALEPSGRAVGASSSVAMFHERSDYADTCWWGMLATHPDRRGAGIASHLGALVLLEMERRFGYRKFFTGIRTGNTPSETLCSQLGFKASDQHVLLGIDPSVLSGGRVTK